MVFKEAYGKCRTFLRRLNRIQGFISRSANTPTEKDHSSGEAGRVGMATNASYVSYTGFSSKRNKSTGSCTQPAELQHGVVLTNRTGSATTIQH